MFRTLYLMACVFAIGITVDANAENLPKPKLGFVRVSEQVTNGVAFRMYEVEVENREKFDNELFVPSPALPPCGTERRTPRGRG